MGSNVATAGIILGRLHLFLETVAMYLVAQIDTRSFALSWYTVNLDWGAINRRLNTTKSSRVGFFRSLSVGAALIRVVGLLLVDLCFGEKTIEVSMSGSDFVTTDALSCRGRCLLSQSAEKAYIKKNKVRAHNGENPFPECDCSPRIVVSYRIANR